MPQGFFGALGNRLVTGVMRVERVFCVCAVGSAGVPARRTLRVESLLTQRREDAGIFYGMAA